MLKIGINAHDEMFFIIVHQTYELWFKQILHQLNRVETDFGTIPVTDDAMARIVRGLNHLRDHLSQGLEDEEFGQWTHG